MYSVNSLYAKQCLENNTLCKNSWILIFRPKNVISSIFGHVPFNTIQKWAQQLLLCMWNMDRKRFKNESIKTIQLETYVFLCILGDLRLKEIVSDKYLFAIQGAMF